MMRPAPFLPDKETLEYLAALLTVLAIGYAAYHHIARKQR